MASVVLESGFAWLAVVGGARAQVHQCGDGRVRKARVGVRVHPEVDEARVRQRRVIGEAEAGHTSEREEGRLIRAQTWADEVSGNALSVQRRRVFMLEERDGGEDGVREGHVPPASHGGL